VGRALDETVGAVTDLEAMTWLESCDKRCVRMIKGYKCRKRGCRIQVKDTMNIVWIPF